MADVKVGKEDEVVFEYTPDPADDSQVSLGYPSADPPSACSKDVSKGSLGKAFRKRIDYETLGANCGRGFEPPEQRLLRLTQEVAELIQIAEGTGRKSASVARDDNTFGTGSNAAAVTTELRVLEKRLGALARDGIIGNPETKIAPSAATPISLASQLERLAANGASAFASGSKEGRVTYELNYTPVADDSADQSKIASVEKTIASIEKQLGVSDNNCPFADLQAAVMQAERRFAAIDGPRLEAIKNGVAKTMKEVETVMKKREDLDGLESDPALDEKTNELFEFCHRWNAVAPSMPTVISRLQSLQAHHQESNAFSERLAALEVQQEELTKILETTNGAVETLGKTMQENMKIIRDRVRDFEGKITKVIKP